MAPKSSNSCNPGSRRTSAGKIRILAVIALGLSLAACGGSGGGGLATGGDGGGDSGGGGNGWVPGVYLASSTFQSQCAAPRAGTNDIQGTSTDENNFLRSYSDDTYLWYAEIVDEDPALFATAEYFNRLKTDATTPSNNPKDQFHFTFPTDDWIALSQSGASAGYGTQFALLQSSPPRHIVVAYTDPNTPASAETLERGAEILTVDGVDVINGNDTDTLNAAFFPSSAGETHSFTVRDLGSATTRSFSMVSAIVTSTPVQNVKTIPNGAGNVGYLLFNDHIATAERGLFDAVTQLAASGIDELVVDVRYNGGGFLDIASEFAYMIAGAAQTGGRTFELLTFNDKHPATNPVTGQPITPVGFHSQSRGFDPSLPSGTTLPTLNLSRVFVLTGSGTCSASESIINSLRGVGVEVIQIGSTTCGKPYGFYATGNCGTHYFTIQFRGENELGFGDYADGFTPENTLGVEGIVIPGCSVADDFGAALGDPAENRLAAALEYAETGTCPPPTGIAAAGLSKATGESGEDLLIPKSPWHQNRIIER
jgi:carboxyl-terminal processing protease